jgi:mRNA-degrading endonuclease toxin of MazEF toxin-antitoxin module
LRKGEGGLPRAFVVNVTRIATVDRSDVESSSVRLSRGRLAEIWDGIRLVLDPTGS